MLSCSIVWGWSWDVVDSHENVTNSQNPKEEMLHNARERAAYSFQCKEEAILGTTHKRTVNLQPLPAPYAPSSSFIQSRSGCCQCVSQ